MKINQRKYSSILTAAALLTCLTLASAGSSGSDIKNKSGKKSEASKEEKANTKLPPCGACTNLVASFDQVKNDFLSRSNYPYHGCHELRRREFSLFVNLFL